MIAGDWVRLTEATANHPWTEKLVGEDGHVEEMRGKKVVVSGLVSGESLWFVADQLEKLNIGSEAV